MPVNKARAQNESILELFFQVLNTGGTPSIAEVSPEIAAGDISVADTATGRFTVTIKNFKGRRGIAKVFYATRTTSVWASTVSPSYSGDDLSFEISIESDASTLTDATVDVHAVAY